LHPREKEAYSPRAETILAILASAEEEEEWTAQPQGRGFGTNRRRSVAHRDEQEGRPFFFFFFTSKKKEDVFFILHVAFFFLSFEVDVDVDGT
jgi:hypothetical protein